MSDPMIGRRVVTCPGCGQERWHGIGPCFACGAPGTAEPRQPPARVCCGQRHYGAECPDGKVMCCICFERVTKDELAIDASGARIDMCQPCGEGEGEA